MIRQERVNSELVRMADTMMNQSLTYCSDSCVADCLELRS